MPACGPVGRWVLGLRAAQGCTRRPECLGQRSPEAVPAQPPAGAWSALPPAGLPWRRPCAAGPAQRGAAASARVGCWAGHRDRLGSSSWQAPGVRTEYCRAWGRQAEQRPGQQSSARWRRCQRQRARGCCVQRAGDHLAEAGCWGALRPACCTTRGVRTWTARARPGRQHSQAGHMHENRPVRA